MLHPGVVMRGEELGPDGARLRVRRLDVSSVAIATSESIPPFLIRPSIRVFPLAMQVKMVVGPSPAAPGVRVSSLAARPASLVE
jgi:hypothetical protein